MSAGADRHHVVQRQEGQRIGVSGPEWKTSEPVSAIPQRARPTPTASSGATPRAQLDAVPVEPHQLGRGLQGDSGRQAVRGEVAPHGRGQLAQARRPAPAWCRASASRRRARRRARPGRAGQARADQLGRRQQRSAPRRRSPPARAGRRRARPGRRRGCFRALPSRTLARPPARPGSRARYSSMKVLPAGAGKSRCAVQPPASGSSGSSRRARTAASPARHGGAEPVERRPPGHEAPRARCRSGSPAGSSPSRQLRSRQPRSSVGSGMSTGQTSWQRPFMVQACGRSRALGEAVEGRRQHGAHRARVDGAVGVAADLAVDDAVVHAGAAADAAQHLAAAPRAACAVRPLSTRTMCISSGPSASPGRFGPQWKVVYWVSSPPVAERTSSRSMREGVRGRRHQLLDPRGHDVHARRGRGELGVALVGDGADRAACRRPGSWRRRCRPRR